MGDKNDWKRDFFDKESKGMGGGNKGMGGGNKGMGGGMGGSRARIPPSSQSNNTNIGGLPVQAQEMIRFFNGLTDRCFSDCIHNFSQRQLTHHEKSCIDGCAKKSMKSNKRIARIFTESMLLMSQDNQNNGLMPNKPFDF